MKLLKVRWSESEMTTYYVDADKYSRAHDRRYEITLDSFSGTYHFNKSSKIATLDTGVEIREVSVLNWELIEE